MKGIEISRAFFEQYGRKMLVNVLPGWEEEIAVGLVGSGSECLGFDDSVSRDHDFDPGFMIFLPDEKKIDRACAFRLEKEYAALPREFLGLKRDILVPVGGQRRGVIRLEEFLHDRIGRTDAGLTDREWLSVPETQLNEVVNGELFSDHPGIFTEVRKKLSFFPENVFRLKLAGYLHTAGQSGQYNYPRCLAHREPESAQLACCIFVHACMHILFLLNGRYMPFYKWSFRALRELPDFSELSDSLSHLLLTGNGKEEAALKTEVIESLSSILAGELKNRSLSVYSGDDLEGHAYSVRDGIRDAAWKGMSILSGVEFL